MDCSLGDLIYNSRSSTPTGLGKNVFSFLLVFMIFMLSTVRDAVGQ